MGKFNNTLSHQQENSDKMAMIARQAPARVLARLSFCKSEKALPRLRNSYQCLVNGVPETIMP